MKYAQMGIVGLMLAVSLICTRDACSQDSAPKLLSPVPKDNPTLARVTESERFHKLREQPTTKSLHVVQVDATATKGHELRVCLPDEKTLLVTRTGGDEQSEGDRTWFGSVEGSDSGTITLVVRNGEVTGSINTVGGLYRIVPLTKSFSALISVNTSKFPSEEPPQR